ncbi:MAG: hypothetical protein AAF514_20675 [Verrucomicrobiota bacterium]
MVSAHDCQGERIVVQLRDGDNVLDEESFESTGQMVDRRVTLKWKATRLGMQSLELRVQALEDEFSTENNAERVEVQVVDDQLRILLADQFPRWEYRYLLNLFRRAPRVDFETVLFAPQHHYPGRPRRPEPARLPTTPEDWARFRIVILGDLSPSNFNSEQQGMLRDYLVEGGGNLIVIAGEKSMPSRFRGTEFSQLLPVDSRPVPTDNRKGFRLEVAPAGRGVPPIEIGGSFSESRELWREMSEKLPVYHLSPFSKPRPLAHVLLRAQPGNRAFLSWQYVGRGRVVYLSAPAIYQLRYRKGDQLHYQFWGQLLRWIMARDLGAGSRTVKISTEKTRYRAGDDAEVSVRLMKLSGHPVSGARSELVALQDGKVVKTVPLEEEKEVPGEYRAVLKDLPQGKMVLEPRGRTIRRLLKEESFDGPAKGELVVDPHDSRELRNPLADLALLESIAGASRASVLPPGAVGSYLKNLDFSPTVTKREDRQPLWSRWILIWAVLLLFLVEWIGRKLIGLV